MTETIYRWSHATVWLNVIILFTIVAWTLWDNRYFIWPIHIIHETAPLTPTIQEGETLKIRAVVTRREICAPTVVRFTYRVVDGRREIVSASSSPGAMLGLGERQEGVIPIAGTERLPPGCYVVSGYVSSVCGSRTVTVPTIEYGFCVEAAK